MHSYTPTVKQKMSMHSKPHLNHKMETILYTYDVIRIILTCLEGSLGPYLKAFCAFSLAHIWGLQHSLLACFSSQCLSMCFV